VRGREENSSVISGITIGSIWVELRMINVPSDPDD